MVGVIGPDGVGKSTLAGADRGRAQDPAGQGLRSSAATWPTPRHLKVIRGRIAYMPQGLGRNLYPTLSVFENIDFFGRLFGQGAEERRGAHHRTLDRDRPGTRSRTRPAGKLSGGMKQKLSLCCALINDPDLLILDEPTTGVDPLSRGQFWDLINTIRARRPHMSVIVATAYMDEAQRFDWLMAMDEGKIIADGHAAGTARQDGRAKSRRRLHRPVAGSQARRHIRSWCARASRSPDETPAIEAEGLTRRFGDFVAVDHVNFRIARGEIFGFLGSNGCGKSTTMKMLTGFLPATEGRCKLFGKPMGARRHGDPAQRRLHDAGVLALQRTDRPAESRTARRTLSSAARSKHSRAGIEELLERYDLRAHRRRAARQPAARHQAATAARGRGAARARDPHPRRADFGRRPDRARRLLAHPDRSVARRRRDDLRHDPFLERGGALRPHLADARGQGARGRRAAWTWCASAAATRSRTRSSAISPTPRASTHARRSRRAGARPPRTPKRSRRRAQRASASAGSGPMRGARRSSCGAIRSASPSPRSARSS